MSFGVQMQHVEDIARIAGTDSCRKWTWPDGSKGTLKQRKKALYAQAAADEEEEEDDNGEAEEAGNAEEGGEGEEDEEGEGEDMEEEENVVDEGYEGEDEAEEGSDSGLSTIMEETEGEIFEGSLTTSLQ